MKRVLVAGATGHLGRHVVQELKRQGFHVRALSRARGRLNGQVSAVDEAFHGDLTAPGSLRHACEEIDVVLSCAGASMNLNDLRDRTAFDRVDYCGNRNLLEEAQGAGVRKFVYVSLFQGERFARTAYAGAHERFVRELRESRLPHTVVRPTAFFSFLAPMVGMTKSGRGVVLGTGEVRTNPIHEADLAEVCVAAIASEEREIPVGGPEIYSRRQLVELAFEALGRSPRLLHVPLWTFRGAAAVMRPFNPRLSALLEFGAAVSQVDLVAPAYGTKELKGYYGEVAGKPAQLPPSGIRRDHRVTCSEWGAPGIGASGGPSRRRIRRSRSDPRPVMLFAVDSHVGFRSNSPDRLDVPQVNARPAPPLIRKALLGLAVLTGLTIALALALSAVLLSRPLHEESTDPGERPGPLADPPSRRHIPAESLDAAEAAVRAELGRRAFPGAALALGIGDRIERVSGMGYIGWRDQAAPVSPDTTLYDLASLTKLVATTTAVLLLVEDGRISLDDPVQRHLPAFEGVFKERVTWRHLLTHTSGLPAGANIRGDTPEERVRRLLRTRITVPPGQQVTYTDLGFVVLWEAAQRAAGEPLPRLLARRVWQPLGMHSTRFAPGMDCTACAPTMRLHTGQLYRGLPNDLTARRLGGITGGAGLFSTAHDLARFTALLANGGELDGVRILQPETVREILRQQPGAGRRTLGGTAFCPDEGLYPHQPCTRPLAYGHTGWAGTSLWVDPEEGVWVVLLTNRSYDVRAPERMQELRHELFRHAQGLTPTTPRSESPTGKE